MPLYAYRCDNCGAQFEKLMSLKERCDKSTLIFCPDCGCGEHTPLLSRTSFALKGGGWYKDGYSKNKS